MRVILLKKRHLAALCLLLFLLCALAPPAQEAFSPVEGEKNAVIIDPGHGGEDGGALAADGTKESGINLSIANKLMDLLLFMGCDAEMTRYEDISIHDASAETLRQKKVSDLKNRVAFINGREGAILLSIHQNSLPSDPSVRGAQAFYNPQGQEMAETIQRSLNETVNTHGEKKAKAAPESVYLMKNAAVPAVLIECGFLSSAEETALLKEENHQKRLALAVAAGYLHTP